MQRLGIGIGIDRDGRDPHPPRGRMIRQAISPRLAIRILRNMASRSAG